MKALIILLSLCLNSCLQPQDVEDKSKIVDSMALAYEKQYPDVVHYRVNQLLKDLDKAPKQVLIIDTRKPDEIALAKIKGAITIEDFTKLIETETLPDQLTTIVAYSTIGKRSSVYAQQFNHKEIKVKNLFGGILSWLHAGQKIYDSNGNETKKVHVYSEAWNFVPESYEGVWED